MIGMNIALVLLAAVTFPGLIGWTKAKLSGRKGASVLQPAYDVVRLFGKGSVYSTTTSFVFRLAPTVYFCTVLTALLLLPFGGYAGLLSFDGDIVFFTYVLALGRFMMVVGALDTGSGFEGMGANREALYGMLVEPAMFLLLGSLCLLTDHTNFHDLFLSIHFGSYMSYLLAGLAAMLLVLIAMVEGSRLPVDDPRTHLELTMVHEVIVLDHSGFDLALIQTANAIRFAAFGALISNLVLPEGWPLYGHIGIFIAVQVVFPLLIGWMEAFRARNKLAANPRYILALSAIGFLLFFTVLTITHKFILA